MIEAPKVLFRLEKEGCPTSYIFGTCHLGHFKNNCVYHPESTQGFKQATHVISEVGDQLPTKMIKSKRDPFFGDILESAEGDTKENKSMKAFVLQTFNHYFQNYPWHILPEELTGLKEDVCDEETLNDTTIRELLAILLCLVKLKIHSSWLSRLSLWFSPTYHFYSIKLGGYFKLYNEYDAQDKAQDKYKSYDLTEIPPEFHELPMDMRLTQIAKKENKTILALETKEEQWKMIGSTLQDLNSFKEKMAHSIDSNPLALFHSIALLIEKDPKASLLLLQRYSIEVYKSDGFRLKLKNEVRALHDIYNGFSSKKVPEFPSLAPLLERHVNWVDSICAVIEKNPTFIFVGMGHLGKCSSPEHELFFLLRKKGFSMTAEECPKVPEIPSNKQKAETTSQLSDVQTPAFTPMLAAELQKLPVSTQNPAALEVSAFERQPLKDRESKLMLGCK